MKFIGRKAELAKLNTEYERDGGFVVIYEKQPDCSELLKSGSRGISGYFHAVAFSARHPEA